MHLNFGDNLRIDFAYFVFPILFSKMHILSPLLKPATNAWAQKLKPVIVERAPTIYCPPDDPENPMCHRNKRNQKVRTSSFKKALHHFNSSSSSNREPDMHRYWQAVWSDPSYYEFFQSQSYGYQDENINPLQLQKCNYHSEELLSGSQVEKLAENQLAYYFCRDNLLKDIHLRNMFDREDGTVALTELIKFAKMKSLLGDDIQTLVKIARRCLFVELIEDTANIENCRVRTHDWRFWVDMAGRT